MTKKKSDDLDSRFGTSEDRFEFQDIRDTTDFTYQPASNTKVPQEVRDHFQAQGYRLKWVRFLLSGQVDTANVRMRLREGYDFVRPNELDGEIATLLGDSETVDRFGEVVCNGDVVLMRVPDFKAEARKAYYQNLAKEQADATDKFIRNNQLQNSSKTTVKTGKAARFIGD